MQPPRLTRHARKRLQQRGSRARDAAIVIAYGDIEVPARNGCRYLQLSQKEAARLQREELVAVAEMDRARRLVILADSLDRIITVIKVSPERSTLRSRRAWVRR